MRLETNWSVIPLIFLISSIHCRRTLRTVQLHSYITSWHRFTMHLLKSITRHRAFIGIHTIAWQANQLNSFFSYRTIWSDYRYQYTRLKFVSERIYLGPTVLSWVITNTTLLSKGLRVRYTFRTSRQLFVTDTGIVLYGTVPYRNLYWISWIFITSS